MLTELEFSGKKHIIMDKCNETIIMNRSDYGSWLIREIPKDAMTAASKPELVDEGVAFLYYKERMESYGFKPFPVIVE